MLLGRKAYLVAWIVLSIGMGMNSCSDDDKSSGRNYVYLGEVVVNGASTVVSLWAADTVKVGYNRLFVRLEDLDGHEVADAHIAVSPMMHMDDMGMTHAGPFSTPSEEAVDGYFAFHAVFQMASYDSGYWVLTVDFHNHDNDMEGSAEFEVPVIASGLVKMPLVNDTTYIVVLAEPRVPSVGLNVITFGIYKKENMMSYPPLDGVTITMVPTMPSMGHGSSNNVDPVGMGNGMYEGRVNFSMSGEWRIDLDCVKDTSSFSTYFEVDVP